MTESQSTLSMSLLSSCIAGFVSRIACHPIDTIKARLQANQGVVSIGNVYRGLVAALVGGVPATCMYLTSYEMSKSTLSEVPILQNSPFLVYFTSGMVAETCSCLVFVPTDVIKERLQVQQAASHYKYKGSLDALVQIISQEGLRGLYKGYGASLLSFGPFSALYFAFYEAMKKRQSSGNGPTGDTFLNNLYSSSIAGAGASFITNPLDLAKLRLQVSRTASTSGPTTTWGMLLAVHAAEGTRGLFRGAWARILFHTPNTAITMCAYEECKRLFSIKN